MAVLPTGIGPVTGGYQIERSLRFNSADSAYLNRTPASAGNRRTFTISYWIKRSALGSTQYLFAAGSGTTESTWFSNALDIATVQDQIGTATWTSSGGYTNAVLRDPSAWYHIVIAIDTTQATASNRSKLYINGVLQTYTGAVTISQNADLAWNNSGVVHYIGARLDSGPRMFFDGYLTEVYNIDGQALTPSSFGQSDPNTGVWSPIKYTGTYGTNGFYLKFADNSNTTAATLGKDSSGNGNNWTPNNFSVTAGAGNDSLVDTPTSYGSDTGVGGEVRGNYCTLNPLTPPVNGSLSNGNLLFTGATDWGGSKSTIAIPTTGKWYAEFTLGSTSSNSAQADVGIFPSGNTNYYDWTGSYGLELNNSFFLITNGSYSSARSGTTAGGTVLQIAVDADAGKVWFGVANAWYDTFNTTNGNPGAGTNPSGSSINFSTTTYFMGVKTDFNNWTANFGQRPFAYTAPSGFKALCTQNLPTPTIGATSTTQANDYFDVSLYTGTGSSLNITGLQFQPDFVWIKERAGAADHGLYDAVRGVQKQLESNTTTAETTETTGLTAFNSDGFTVGALAQLNTNTDTYVAWQWKESVTAGFDIVAATANGSGTVVFNHNLGTTPSFVIIKNREAATNWNCWHTKLSSATDSYIVLNSTNAAATSTGLWSINSSSVTIISQSANDDYISYIFSEVAGYSAFGSYTGNGSTDGPFVYTGFRPRFILYKSATSGAQWVLLDTARNTYNVSDLYLFANASDAEGTFTLFDITSNGFKVRTSNSTSNGNGDTYIYAAFAESPFKYSLAR